MVNKKVLELLNQCKDNDRHFPATLLYEEGWLLRLVLDWFSNAHQFVRHHPYFTFCEGATWYSEARLKSRFRKTAKKADVNLTETHTHADGCIGQFKFRGKAGLELQTEATQFVVIEAKMFSGLATCTRNVKNYNQASRTVACMAYCLEGMNLKQFRTLQYCVIAPEEKQKSFASLLCPKHVTGQVEERCRNFCMSNSSALDDTWINKVFYPTMDKLEIKCFTWEEIISQIKSLDPGFGEELCAFYMLCKHFNRKGGQFLERL